MKEYLIWLKSGETICGTAEEETIKMLQNKFKNHEYEEDIFSFSDNDGTVVLDMDRVETIAINKCVGNKKVGFKS